MNDFYSGDNPDLFYDNQIKLDKLCWILENESGSIRGLLNSTELSYGISNSYTSHSDYDLVNSSVKGTLQPMARKYMTQGSAVENLLNQLKGDLSKGNALERMGGSILGMADSAASALLGTANSAANNLLNRISPGVTTGDVAYGEFISAFDQAKFWEGTFNRISLPELKTTLFDEDGNSLKSKLRKLHQLVTGDWVDAKEELSGMWAIQRAPNGYKPDFSAGSLTDPNFPGTFTLRVGDKSTIKNLVITDLSVEVSQFSRIKPDKSISNNPMMATVSITVEPAGYLSRPALEKYLNMNSNV